MRYQRRFAFRYGVLLALPLSVLCCGKTSSDTKAPGGGGTSAGADGSAGAAGTPTGGSGGATLDASDADACADAGFGAYQNSTCCPGVPNCGMLSQWFCTTSPCVDRCPLPKFIKGEPCPIGRACVGKSDVGCFVDMCICQADGWHCASGDCTPDCGGSDPGMPCAEPGKSCQYGAATCTCSNGVWSCVIAGDAG